jgi:NTP pyrophosphatase (non-canonical NTP hydrolase)
MTNQKDLKFIGKLGEEVNELGTAIFRCVIQGIDECHPVIKKVNRDWLQDEVADVLANIELVIEHLRLDKSAIYNRIQRKKAHLREWHEQVP